MRQNRLTSGKRRHTDAAARAEVLAALDRSGLSVPDFARRQGVHFTTLYAWRRRREQAKASPAFVQVELDSPVPPSELVIEMGPARLRLTSVAQLPLAAGLLQMLQEGRPC